MRPLDTNPVTSYHRARRKYGMPRLRAARLTVEDALLQIRSWRKYHTLLGQPRRNEASP